MFSSNEAFSVSIDPVAQNPLGGAPCSEIAQKRAAVAQRWLNGQVETALSPACLEL